MAYIFLDESGDLGFDFTKKHTSQFFVITFLFVENKRLLEKVIKKTHAELKEKYKKQAGVLHCFKEKPVTRQRLLRRLGGKDCTVMVVYLNKRRVYTKLQNEKQVLYNYVANILLDRIYSKKLIPIEGAIELIASRRETNKFLNENFKDYLNSQIQNKHKGNMKIAIRTSHEEKGLQAVDFVSWAIYRKYECRDDSYYNLIKNRVVEENPLFP